MRRRPPVTVVAFIALLAILLLIILLSGGPQPVWFVGCAIIGGVCVGLYLGLRSVWLGSIAFLSVNLLTAPFAQAWGAVVSTIALLTLLVLPPTRRYFRPSADANRRPSRGGRVARMTAVVVAGVLLGVLATALLFSPDPIAGDLDQARSDRPGLRVLLIGNALVSDNSMPSMVRQLEAGSAGSDPIFVVRYARRGSKLSDVVDDDKLTDLLAEVRWNVVVLQEHSQVIARNADRETFAAATDLERLARGAGATTLLLSNPGYAQGDRDLSDRDTRAAMQARIGEGGAQLAARLTARVAPVGQAWEDALSSQPGLDLWQSDGIRPNRAGSYLTACVLYATLTGEDPTASSYTGGLDAAQAQAAGGRVECGARERGRSVARPEQARSLLALRDSDDNVLVLDLAAIRLGAVGVGQDGGMLAV